MGEECIHNGQKQLQATCYLSYITERTEECYKIRGRRRGKAPGSFKTLKLTPYREKRESGQLGKAWGALKKEGSN